MKITKIIPTAIIMSTLAATAAFGAAHAKLGVKAMDQDVSEGTVTAAEITAGENGWLVVHRTDDTMAPGPVVGHAPLKKGVNADVAAILTEEVKAGEKLMLMVHSEAGGTQTGVFEYTLGAKEDGPIRVDEKLVMTVISAQ